MSRFAVKNDKGEWLSFDSSHESVWYTNNPTFFNDKSYAEAQAGPCGHVVELVEQFEGGNITNKEALAKIIREAKRYADDYISEDTMEFEIKLALNAYKPAEKPAPEKEKKYLLPMDGTLEENDDNDNFQLYAYCYKGRWLADEVETDPSYQHNTVTQKELETAPAWVKAIKPLEVTDYEQ